jgi:hypothetical protein
MAIVFLFCEPPARAQRPLRRQLQEPLLRRQRRVYRHPPPLLRALLSRLFQFSVSHDPPRLLPEHAKFASQDPPLALGGGQRSSAGLAHARASLALLHFFGLCVALSNSLSWLRRRRRRLIAQPPHDARAGSVRPAFDRLAVGSGGAF